MLLSLFVAVLLATSCNAAEPDPTKIYYKQMDLYGYRNSLCLENGGDGSSPCGIEACNACAYSLDFEYETPLFGMDYANCSFVNLGTAEELAKKYNFSLTVGSDNAITRIHLLKGSPVFYGKTVQNVNMLDIPWSRQTYLTPIAGNIYVGGLAAPSPVWFRLQVLSVDSNGAPKITWQWLSPLSN